MKTLKTLFLTGLALFAMSSFAWSASTAPPGIETHLFPALYKTAKGPVQKVRVTVKHEGASANATITLGDQSRKVKLNDGPNPFFFEIPQVQSTVQLPLTVTVGKEQESTRVEVKPVRHWQMNMVQHTHTDIGYTRSQTEILAEHLRYIDYALDYCDATDNYPDFAKFRWTFSTWVSTQPRSIERICTGD